MFRHIFLSIVTVAFGVFIVALAMIFGFAYEYFSDQQLLRLREECGYVASGVTLGGEDFLHALDGHDTRVTWISPDGRVLFDSASDASEMDNHLEREEVRLAAADKEGVATRVSSTLSERMLYCARRLPDGSVVRLAASHFSVARLMLSMGWPIAVTVAVVMVLAFAFAWNLAVRIVGPLDAMNLDNPDLTGIYEELHPLINRITGQRTLLGEQTEELRREQSAREAAEGARREFSANVSHELKTPLQTISGSAELLARGMVELEDVPRFGEKIHAESTRLIRLIDDIINLSKLDEGAPMAETSEVDLRDLVADVVEELADTARTADVTLTKRADASVLVRGIPQYLRAMVFNLVDNAIKYNRRRGKVTVALDSAADGARLSVADTGIGIPPEEQTRVFERFYRVDKSRSKSVDGTGLGLSIVKHAAILNRAKVNLASTPGLGTTVTVEFHDS